MPDALAADSTVQVPISLSADLEVLAALAGAGARGEWRLVYQPKVLAQTRRVESVEALLRWEHPVMGAVSPDRFVAVAETAAMMGELTVWVLAEALDAQVRWRAAGVKVAVAVNLSAQLVGDYELLEWLKAQVEARQLEPSCLTLEITETAVMAEPDTAIAYLTALRSAGLRVSIDDFGTGYTSLSVLTRLPLDELKIDQSFVRRSATSVGDEAVIRSVRELGHRLGLDVVAEGVEDEATASRLTEIGVDILQGYFFAKPLPEHAVTDFIARQDHGGRNPSGQLDPRVETARLAALHRYGILDSESDAGLDDITQLAAQICDTPIALVSLVDMDHQHFASRHGLDIRATPRSDSFCAHALTGPDLLEINDAQIDPRFTTNPLVTGDPNIRFYAGSPLRTPDGHTLGSLCVIDRKPRDLTNAQRRSLAALSRTVMRQLETRRITLATQQLHDRLRAILAARTAGRLRTAEQLHLRLCSELTLCNLAMVFHRSHPGSPLFTVTSSFTAPVRTTVVDGLTLDSQATNTLAAAVHHRRAIFVPDLADSALADAETSRRLNLRAAHVQPIIEADETIDSVVVVGWEQPTDNINRTAIELLAATATAIAMTPTPHHPPRTS